MPETQFIKSLQRNYARILLPAAPEEKRYQYCILKRGGIRGLLPCGVRYIDSDSYLYYDITSKQTLEQLYRKKCIDREWVRDLAWNVRRIRQELSRFLLDDRCLMWFPSQVYQELGGHEFSFIYLPYYEGDNGFGSLMDYIAEHADYKDEKLIECIYKMCDSYARCGDSYLQGLIYEDVRMIEEPLKGETAETSYEEDFASEMPEQAEEDALPDPFDALPFRKRTRETPPPAPKKNFFSFLEGLDGSRRRNRELREHYQEMNLMAVEGYSAAQNTEYEIPSEEDLLEEEEREEADDGKTVFFENVSESTERSYRLYLENGKVLCTLGKEGIVLGKKEGEADVVLSEVSVSRMHARVFMEKEKYYVEDLNSTNGTFKNGLRLQPYEKKVLQQGDELRLGAVVLVFR